MIRASRNSSLRPRRSKLLRSIAHQRETRKDLDLEPLTTSSTRQCHQSQRELCQTYLIYAVAVSVAVLVVAVAVAVAGAVYLVLEVYFVSYTRCNLSSTLMSSPPFRFN
jgi:hypothetical protein